MAAGFLLCPFSANNTYASDVAQTTPGGVVTVAATAVAGAQPITFNPSTNVNMDGATSATAFAIDGWHEQAELKTAGQGYGMASDTNKMFFIDISQAISATTITGTNSGAFSSWNTM